MAFLLVCLGAAVGAPARYLLDRAVQSRHTTGMPWGTLTVNATGSLVLGVLTGLAVHGQLSEAVSLSVGTGFCGALTTWSTLSHDTLRLYEAGALPAAVANVALNLAVGLAAASVGYAAAAAV